MPQHDDPGTTTAVFVTSRRRRRVAVGSLGALLFALGTVWLASLVVGALGFLSLPPLTRAPLTGRGAADSPRARPNTRLLSGFQAVTRGSAESDRASSSR